MTNDKMFDEIEGVRMRKRKMSRDELKRHKETH